jgi:hypothetical protein
MESVESKGTNKHLAPMSPLLFSIALEYAIWKVGVKLNGTHQILAYADDVSLLGDNVNTIKNFIETSVDVSKEVSLEINVEKAKYMMLSPH